MKTFSQLFATMLVFVYQCFDRVVINAYLSVLTRPENAVYFFRILRRQKSRYTHYYFHIRDEVLGPLLIHVGSFLPFPATCWINGHGFIQRELLREGIKFKKHDNALTHCADPQAPRSPRSTCTWITRCSRIWPVPCRRGGPSWPGSSFMTRG